MIEGKFFSDKSKSVARSAHDDSFDTMIGLDDAVFGLEMSVPCLLKELGDPCVVLSRVNVVNQNYLIHGGYVGGVEGCWA